MYRETRIPRLRAALWVSIPEAADLVSPSPSLIVPDGCMDLIVIDGQVIIAGADSAARTFHSAPVPTVGLRFDPGVLPQLLSTSAAELADAITPLDAVLSDRVAGSFAPALLGIAAAMPDPFLPGDGAGAPILPGDAASLDSVTTRDAAGGGDAPRRLIGIAESLMSRVEIELRPMALARLLGAQRDARQFTIAEVAADFAYSPRQLRRLSAEWFGYGPKHLAKVLRWKAAREFIDEGRTRTSAAVAAGFADAAHLWRDEQSLLGR